MKINWLYIPGNKNQAPLYYFDCYVISERLKSFTLSYRPPGEHNPLGTFETLEQAKCVAEEHFKNLQIINNK